MTEKIPEFMALDTAKSTVSWGDLRNEFLEGVRFAQDLELETRDEAEGRVFEEGSKLGRWRRRQRRLAKNQQKKPELPDLDLSRGFVPPHTRSPFRTQTDQELLSAALDYARDPPPVIQESLEKEVASPKFVEAWGRFSFALGIIDANYLGQSDGLHDKRRGGLGRGETSSDWHQQYFVDWVSTCMSRLQEERGDPTGHDRDWRKYGEREFVNFVTEVLSDGRVAPGGDPAWFEAFIRTDTKKPDDGPKLRTTYSSISRERFDRIAKDPIVNRSSIPPLG